jgi:hypothetical protein
MNRINKNKTMTTTVQVISSPEQLDDGVVSQLGSINAPCTVLFGLSHYDAEKKYRAVKMIPPPAAIHALTDLLKDTPNGDEQMVCIKVSAGRTVMTGIDGERRSIDDLKAGTQCMCVVRAFHWAMNGRSGVSLQAQALRILGHRERERVSYGFV